MARNLEWLTTVETITEDNQFKINLHPCVLQNYQSVLASFRCIIIAKRHKDINTKPCETKNS